MFIQVKSTNVYAMWRVKFSKIPELQVIGMEVHHRRTTSFKALGFANHNERPVIVT